LGGGEKEKEKEKKKKQQKQHRQSTKHDLQGLEKRPKSRTARKSDKSKSHSAERVKGW